MTIKIQNLLALLIIYHFILSSIYVLANEYKTNSINAMEMFAEIQKRYPSIKEFDIEEYKDQIPGIYSTYGPTKLEHVDGGTSGSLFYIFPDGSYFYTQWADIMRETIYEKGNWYISNSYIVLENDDSLPYVRTRSRYYLPFRLRNGNIVIMGSDWEYQDFIKHWSDGFSVDPEFELLLSTHEKSKHLHIDEAQSIKSELIESSWKPSFFSWSIWGIKNVEDGCSLDTIISNIDDKRIFLDMGFIYHPSGDNKYLNELGITSKLPYVYILLNDFTYKDLIDNKDGILSIILEGQKGFQYVKRDEYGEYNYHIFDNKIYETLLDHLKNHTEFNIEFNTKNGLLKSSLKFTYEWYEEDLEVDDKVNTFNECIQSHNKSLKNGTAKSAAP